jgi:hypothetical protein
VNGDGEPRSVMLAMIGARLPTPFTALTPARMLLFGFIYFGSRGRVLACRLLQKHRDPEECFGLDSPKPLFK